MFRDFYQMHEEPFGVTPDHRFLYLGESHREALASLFYGIESDRGFMVLIAHPGFGKTTLIHQLLDKLQPDARTVFLFQTQCNSRELIQYLLNDLGVDVNGMETVTMHNKLSEILAQERLAGRRFILIVDEAQNLDPSVLETIRLLSNFETSRTKLLQILLVGQPQLAAKLASPALKQLQQRISVFAKLQPFDAEETARYIAHRLKVAGYTGGELFTTGAMDILKDRSQGIPRNINRLCFSALSLGCAMGRKKIDAEMMREVVADLEMESIETEAQIRPFSAPRPSSLMLTSGSPVISYPAQSNSRHRRWAMAVTSVAASLLLAFGLLSYSHGTIGRFLPAKTPASPTGANATPASRKSAQVSAHATAAAVPSPAVPSPGEKSLNAPPVTPVAPSAPGAPVHDPAGDDHGTVKVVVRSGETLKQIALRTLGQDDSKLLKQIQQLNPRMTNPDHIEADQEIRLPQISKASNTPPVVGANDLSRKN
jgi:general secretion pathway protein A